MAIIEAVEPSGESGGTTTGDGSNGTTATAMTGNLGSIINNIVSSNVGAGHGHIHVHGHGHGHGHGGMMINHLIHNTVLPPLEARPVPPSVPISNDDSSRAGTSSSNNIEGRTAKKKVEEEEIMKNMECQICYGEFCFDLFCFVFCNVILSNFVVCFFLIFRSVYNFIIVKHSNK